MNNFAIKVENLSKAYQLGQFSTGTLSQDITRWWALARGKEDPFLRIGEVNDRSKKGTSNIVWSLKDINFSVMQGEAVGIIGKNGAGKSTLLKILSKVTSPTTGTAKIKGRIASLLEVGTGFHPELTGRENIFLNGAILGMRKKEISRKLDEIIDFSGVERYIDTPVKRYSSGMYVRLAFAVAAHLESEILIVDEVLAVGDAEFQKKCLGKMGDVSKTEGRTVLFVSHNLGAVKELCTGGILLHNGGIAQTGDVKEVVRTYLGNPLKINSSSDLIHDTTQRRGNGEVRFSRISINNDEMVVDPTKKITVDVTLIVNQPVDQLYFSMMIRGPVNGDPVANTGPIRLSTKQLQPGSTVSFSFVLSPNVMMTGLFPVYLWLGKKGELAGENYPYDVVDSVYYLNLNTLKSAAELGYNSDRPPGYCLLQGSIEKLSTSAAGATKERRTVPKKKNTT